MTPDDIALAVRNRYNAIGDPFFSDDMIYDAIYQACLIMTNEGMVIERTYSTESVNGTREYAYPNNATSIRRVEYKGVKLFPRSLEDDPKTSVTEPQGTPSEYAIWNYELILFPTPDEDGHEIKVFTFNNPQRVTASSTLEVPEAYHMDIVDFILSVFYAKDQQNQMATYHRNLWERALNRIKRHNMKRQYGDEYAVVRDEAEVPAHPGILL